MKETSLQGSINVCILLFQRIFVLNAKLTARGVTSAHGQFIVMGGFMLFKDGRPFQVLSPEKFTQLIDAGCIEFPFITKEEIYDKSKGQPVLGAIAFLQTLWFLIQCIARGVRGLSITQLEMVTLALVAMHGLLLFLWWHKPLDTRGYIRIDLIRVPPTAETEPQHDDTDASIKWDFTREKALGKQLKTIFKAESYFRTRRKDSLFIRILKISITAPLYFLERVFVDYGELFLRLETEIIPEGETEVSIFYAPDTSDNLGASLFGVENILGSLFAAAHISMWFSPFPTHRDQMVWRVCSVVTAALPLLFIIGISLLVGIYVISLFLTNRFAEIMLKVMQGVAMVVVISGFVAMMAARMALIVEAFVCLQALSTSAQLAVPWTNYIPHFS